MRFSLPLTVLLAVVVVVAAIFVGYGLTSSGSGGTNRVAASTLSITAAGTLGTLFPQLASALGNSTPGISAPLAAQTYGGSLVALARISALHQSFDVAAAADFRLIPLLLEPAWASYELVFASTPEVLTYDPTLPAFSGINTTNWAAKITAPGVRLGIANASTDPNGYNGIFVLELQGALTSGSLSAIYGHFFTTPVGSFAIPNAATTQVEQETQVATLLATHEIQAFITYRSYAVAHHLAYVSFDQSVGLGNETSSYLSTYGEASTTILSTNGPTVVRGAPVLFAATVPTNALNATLGTAFLQLLFSTEGSSLISANGFTPIVPGWVDRPAAVPSLLAADVVPLPSSLLSDLG